MKENLKEIINEAGASIQNNAKVVVFGHVNPDGDAIGSTLGIYHFLKPKVSEIFVVVPNDFPNFLNWLPGSNNIIVFEKSKELAKQLISEADVLFFCDFNDPKRLNGAGDFINKSDNVKIMIDHHPLPVDFVDFMISDTSVSSTAELVFEYIEEQMDGQQIDKTIAECLMTGIITDTGLFNHNSETTRTFEIFGELLKSGADKKKIINKLYNENSFGRMQLLGNILHNCLKFFPEYGTSYVYLSEDDQQKYNYQNGDVEGVVNIALSIAGANLAAIFIEKDDHIKVSFRSIGSFDVNELARKHYKGGGHTNASGGKSFQTLNKTLDDFVELIKEYKDKIKQP